MAKMAVGSWSRNSELVFGGDDKLVKKAASIIKAGEKGSEKKQKNKLEANHREEVRAGKRRALSGGEKEKAIEVLTVDDDSDEELVSC